MGTIVGIETGSGTILAGDRRVVSGNTIRSNNKQKVFDFPSVRTAATGEPDGIDEFSRMLESEIQRYRTEQSKEMGIQRLANVGATVAETAGVDAIVSAYDDKGIALIREIGDDGRILDDKVLALGSGAQVALGRLERADLDVDLYAAESLVQDVLATVAEHDSMTGSDVDVWRLENSNSGPNKS
ncbi:20S proteasome subunit A/B [Haladaptatus halobius]|uniref:20S proteasome subunit A/B n=1 Tax=Haladaptatus halobius TaxID=2884875 RepID=UPI001D0B2F4D|nr:20S proteasome subunit A/B [Haladaptatus halobius]